MFWIKKRPKELKESCECHRKSQESGAADAFLQITSPQSKAREEQRLSFQ